MMRRPNIDQRILSHLQKGAAAAVAAPEEPRLRCASKAAVVDVLAVNTIERISCGPTHMVAVEHDLKFDVFEVYTWGNNE